MENDAVWYETAFVTGATNGLLSLAESLVLPLPFAAAGGARQPLVPLPADDELDRGVLPIFADINAYYGTTDVPAVYRYLASDPGYLRDTWNTVQAAFADRVLRRKFKECIALGVAVAARSPFGLDLHRTQALRLGVTEKGIREVVQTAQLFNTYTKIADVLQLEPDFPDVT
ncbi:MAG: carboxymuconolactone decarboxylase family protein [Candidatus Tectomicrobia bacterium]|nr:carboxymuconolactone decarboxylase family protein [Candidatus Tectomicrobia bacterium]